MIDTARLAPDGESVAGELDSACLEMQGEKWVRPLGCLGYSLEVQLFGTELFARGRLWQEFNAVCSRCGGDFTFSVAVDDFAYSVEVLKDSPIVDLTDEFRQCILLALPTYPVCREDCRGVCPQCGGNLNEGDCPCKDVQGDLRWNALDALGAGMKPGTEEQEREE